MKFLKVKVFQCDHKDDQNAFTCKWFARTIIVRRIFQRKSAKPRVSAHFYGIVFFPKKHHIRCSPPVWNFPKLWYLRVIASHKYLQELIRRGQYWRSKGYSLKSMGQDTVNDILVLYCMAPFGKIKRRTFGVRVLWIWLSLSFLTNRSGIQMRFVSVNDKYFIFPAIRDRFQFKNSMKRQSSSPPMLSNINRSSTHCSRSVTCKLYSWKEMVPIG